ncbi:MAG: hypothetical protein ABIR11_07155 [Candidatus Limnocylindrales bacterium]
MTTRYWFRDNDGVITEFTNLVHEPLSVTTKAEEGVAAGSTILVDDPDGTFNVRGLRKVYVTETADTAQSIYVGYTANRKIERGYPYVGAARRWTLNLYDLNSVLDRRLGVGPDWKRPEETDVERVQWVMSTDEASLIEDSIYISTADPKPMDAVDYRGQSWKSVLDDCAQQTGKNYFVANLDSGDPNVADTNDFTLWYGNDDLAVFDSAVRISNIGADIDDTTTLVVGDNATLDRSPDRIADGVYGNYDGGHVYLREPTTATDFARRDVSANWPYVKSATKARNRTRRYLRSLSSEEDIITCTVKVDAARVNIILAGQRVEARFSHLPGYETDYVWMRVIERTVNQLGPWDYEIALTLSAPAPADTSVATYGILYRSGGPWDGLAYWGFPGDTPGAGYVLKPTTGLIEVIPAPIVYNGNHPYYGWKINGSGTVDVEMYATVIGVMIGSYTITYGIALNGVLVASNVQTASGHLVPYGGSGLVTVSGLAVAPDDVLTAVVTCVPGMYFFRTPAGTGQGGERFVVTGEALT